MSLDGGLVDEGVWFRVEDPSAVSAVRRTAERLGAQVGLPSNRVGALAIVAAELASNLAKHADEGRVLVRPTRVEGIAGVELVAIDSGPGMDTDRAGRDGHSTAGTAGRSTSENVSPAAMPRSEKRAPSVIIGTASQHNIGATAPPVIATLATIIS